MRRSLTLFLLFSATLALAPTSYAADTHTAPPDFGFHRGITVSLIYKF